MAQRIKRRNILLVENKEAVSTHGFESINLNFQFSVERTALMVVLGPPGGSTKTSYWDLSTHLRRLPDLHKTDVLICYFFFF